jgi:hypothetical protein
LIYKICILSIPLFIFISFVKCINLHTQKTDLLTFLLAFSAMSFIRSLNYKVSKLNIRDCNLYKLLLSFKIFVRKWKHFPKRKHWVFISVFKLPQHNQKPALGPKQSLFRQSSLLLSFFLQILEQFKVCS